MDIFFVNSRPVLELGKATINDMVYLEIKNDALNFDISTILSIGKTSVRGK